MKIKFLIYLLIPLLAGCSSIHPERMVAEGASFDTHHNLSVAVDVSGGSGAAWLYSETVSTEEFQQALRTSIENSKLFSRIADKATADYLLSVNITYTGANPGFTLTAYVHATWTLSERATNREVWTKEFDTEGTATTDDAFAGGARQDVALERAVKANIEAGLSELASVPLKER